jgi:hypothetical protein
MLAGTKLLLQCHLPAELPAASCMTITMKKRYMAQNPTRPPLYTLVISIGDPPHIVV